MNDTHNTAIAFALIKQASALEGLKAWAAANPRAAGALLGGGIGGIAGAGFSGLTGGSMLRGGLIGAGAGGLLGAGGGHLYDTAMKDIAANNAVANKKDTISQISGKANNDVNKLLGKNSRPGAGVLATPEQLQLNSSATPVNMTSMEDPRMSNLSPGGNYGADVDFLAPYMQGVGEDPLKEKESLVWDDASGQVTSK